ncbi:triacylglycerol lipase-like protein [Clathrospora elynae]|uniref:Carboxylic ester hydrolase n=1 Tax=Clathrospora elynae TaxID=706981 RepID=A0A6A5SHL7_9PLEO|nr:triacylglycerol lipase-like protein [Clathrospora elynae]
MLRLLLCAAVFFQSAVALNETIDLGYAKYRGKDIGNGVLRWAGMRYARSVSRVDGLRFTAPQDPIDERNVMDASKFGSLCIGTNSYLNAEFGEKHSEDCLFINVFAPARATNESLLPVYVFIQGGGFNANGNADYNGADLIDAADDGMIVVNFNYRVGPYGFLAGHEVKANQSLSLNNGLKDQRQALKWVQKHIHEFGGDPGHVTLGGASAGAGSVVLQLTAYGGRDDKLFHAAAAESPAFPPLRDVENSQWQYDALREQTGCADLPCLTALDAVTFQTAVRTLKIPFPGGKNPPIYFWNPTLDYDFITDYTLNLLKAGKFVKVPTIFGDSTHEGINFTPNNIVSLSRAQQFLLDQFPSTNWPAIRKVWNAPARTSFDSRWRALASDVYGHIRYNCPSMNISATYALNNTLPTWQYRWNVGTASHVGELLPIWNNATSAAGVFIQAYWASFIRSYNPNTHAAEYLLAKSKELHSPEWKPSTTGKGKWLEFNDKNVVTMEDVPEEQWKRCDVIDDMRLHFKQKEQTSFGFRQRPLASTYLAIATVLLGVFQLVYA